MSEVFNGGNNLADFTFFPHLAPFSRNFVFVVLFFLWSPENALA